jgi:S1-C subfamily serine protease
MGRKATIGSRDAYGRGELARSIVALRGDVKPGNSGGPVVSRDGGVLGTLFGQRQGSGDGFAVTNEEVEGALAAIGPPLETACVAR